jgi:GLPGLI family protein
MKTLLIVLFTLTTYKGVFAQKAEPILYSVVYQFIHVKDTNNRQYQVRRDMLLDIGATNAKYCNFIKEQQLKQSLKNNTVTIKPQGLKTVVGRPLVIVNSDEGSDEYFYQTPSEKKIFRYEFMAMNLYEVESTLKTINWKITAETKTIQNYTCQKAIGTFSGRTYTAWFTTALPFNYGPWKLWGLPGLIVEAYDDKKEVAFICKMIIKNTDDENLILVSNTRSIKITEEKFVKAKQNFYQDPIGIATAATNNKTNEEVAVNYIDSSGKSVTGKAAKEVIKKESNKSINNPLELKTP